MDDPELEILHQAPNKDLKNIAKWFLEGTTANAPHEAVTSGQRTLEQWCIKLMDRHPSMMDGSTISTSKPQARIKKNTEK
jgi:hypothetical protein